MTWVPALILTGTPETLPAVIDALKPHDSRLLTKLTAWLEEYQVAVGEYDSATHSDTSSIWRPSIEPR